MGVRYSGSQSHLNQPLTLAVRRIVMELKLGADLNESSVSELLACIIPAWD